MALEESWENAWKAAEGSELFAKPFESLWSKEPLKTPLLFLNSTVVETGQRVIVSPLGATETSFSATFHEALDPARSHVYFELLKTNVTLPLGWMLSVKAQDEMKRQLGSEKNAKLMEEVLAPLR